MPQKYQTEQVGDKVKWYWGMGEGHWALSNLTLNFGTSLESEFCNVTFVDVPIVYHLPSSYKITYFQSSKFYAITCRV